MQNVLPLKAGDAAFFLCRSCGRSFSAKTKATLPVCMKILDRGINPRYPHCSSKKYCKKEDVRSFDNNIPANNAINTLLRLTYRRI